MLYDASGPVPVILQEGEPRSDEYPSRQVSEKSVAFLAGLGAAIKRAAIDARRRAIETTGSVPTWGDGKIVYDTEV